MAKEKLLLLDVTGRVVERWLGHDPSPDQRIARYISWATTLLSTRKATHCFAVVDHPLVDRYWRRSFDPEYKSRVERMSPGNIDNTYRIVRELPEMGIPVLMHEGMESLDMLGSLVHHFGRTGGLSIEILSDNFCCHQLLTSTISVVSPFNSNTVTEASFIGAHGIEPRYMADYMALAGKRFGLPATPHVTEAVAKDLIRRFGSVERIVLEAARSNNQSSPLVSSLLSNGPKLVTLAGTCHYETLNLGKLKLRSADLHQLA